MGALQESRWTADAFVEWAAVQPERYELEAGRVLKMAAEQARHALTKHAAARALEDAVRIAGLDCVVFPYGMSVVIDDGHVRVPDAVVQCAPFDSESTVLESPVILVEVASPSSVERDETQKLVEYFQLPSVRHYLLISPTQRLVIHFQRGEHPGKLETQILSEGVIHLSPPGLTVAVADLLGLSMKSVGNN